MIAPNNVVFSTDPHKSVVDAFVKNVAQNGPNGAPLTKVATIPPKIPNNNAYTSNRPVTIISAKNRGTTKFLTGSTPNTCNASSSSRIFLAPRSAVIAVPATPARMIAVTVGANSRIDANTKNPPNLSTDPNNLRKFPACNPGAPYPNATVETSNGNQHNRSANKNWITNSPPYGYGGRTAETSVLPVKIIMSPTCSSKFFVGRNARSATARTTCLQLLPVRALPLHARPEGYGIAVPCATGNRRLAPRAHAMFPPLWGRSPRIGGRRRRCSPSLESPPVAGAARRR